MKQITQFSIFSPISKIWEDMEKQKENHQTTPQISIDQTPLSPGMSPSHLDKINIRLTAFAAQQRFKYHL